MSQLEAGTYVKTPVPAHSISFDGSISSLVTIFGAVTGDTNTVTMVLNFGPQGVIQRVLLTGPRVNLTFTPGDWIIAPDDPEEPMFIVPANEYATDWQPAL